MTSGRSGFPPRRVVACRVAHEMCKLLDITYTEQLRIYEGEDVISYSTPAFSDLLKRQVNAQSPVLMTHSHCEAGIAARCKMLRGDQTPL